MDAASINYLAIASLVLSALSLLVSLTVAFPGMKGVLLAIRDGVLWFALFLAMGGGAFLAWQMVHQGQGAKPSVARTDRFSQPHASR